MIEREAQLAAEVAAILAEAEAVDAIKANTGRSPRRLLADAGYASENNLSALAERSIEAYIALGRDRHGTKPAPPWLPPPGDRLPSQRRRNDDGHRLLGSGLRLDRHRR